MHLIQMQKRNHWMQMNLLIVINPFLMKTKISQIQVRCLIILKKTLHSLKFQNCKNKKSIKIVYLVIRRFQ